MRTTLRLAVAGTREDHARIALTAVGAVLGALTLASIGCLLVPSSASLRQEVCASCATAALLAYLARRKYSVFGRALAYRPLAWIGTFSYSIYLLHDLFLAIAWYWIRDREPDFANHFNLQFFLFWSAVSALAVGGSFGFHVLFERPFMSGKRQKAEQRLAVV